MAVSQALTLTESNTNIGANTSQVRILWTSKQTGESHNLTPRTAYYYVSINGGAEATYNLTYTLHKQTTDTILDVTLTVPHLPDGSGSIKVRTWMNTNISAGVIEKSASLTLTVIPQASTLDDITCSSAYFDGVITYKYTPKDATFYTRCAVVLGNNGVYTRLRDIDLGTGVATQQTRTLTLSAEELAEVYAAMPKETTAILQLELRTHSSSVYNDSTVIGDWSIRNISLTIPEKIVPTVKLSVEPVNTNAWLASKKIYVVGRSGLKATMSSTPSQGATKIVSLGIAAPNMVYADQLIIKKLTTVERRSIVASALDSRNRYGSDTKRIDVLPYSQPAVTKLLVERGTYDAGWTANDEGSDIRVTFAVNLSLTDYNNTYGAKFSLDGAIVTPGYGNTAGLTSGATQTIYLFDVDGEASHELTLFATDCLGEVGDLPTTIPTINVTIEFKANGKGIGIGKTAEEDNLLDVGWDIRARRNLDILGNITKDGIPLASLVEQGTSGVWNYRKWDNGIVECWGTPSVQSGTWSGSNNLYYVNKSLSLPSGLFVVAPNVMITVREAGGAIVAPATTVSTTESFSTAFIRAYGGTDDVLLTLSVYTIGKWK